MRRSSENLIWISLGTIYAFGMSLNDRSCDVSVLSLTQTLRFPDVGCLAIVKWLAVLMICS